MFTPPRASIRLDRWPPQCKRTATAGAGGGRRGTRRDALDWHRRAI